MRIEILNTFEKINGKYSYKGQFQHNSQWIPVSGSIEKPASRDRFKKLLRKSVERQIEDYKQKHKEPEMFTVPAEGVFVNALS